MNYLMIQNAGVAPIEGYTVLGVTTTRDCGVAGTSGMFGSGANFAINTFLRAGLKFWIYIGKTRLEFFTRIETVNDGLVEKSVRRVYCKLGGTSSRTIECGWTLDFGSLDWTEIGMGLREMVSNAIDRTVREGSFEQSIKDGELVITPQTEEQRKAKAGYTRVYVELTEDVQRYFGELPKRFLHFSHDPSQVTRRILPKAERNLGNGETPMIYREGVLVREISDTKSPSLFDYNFKAKEMPIDECRNSSEYATRGACAKLLRAADKDTLSQIFKSLADGVCTFEGNLDSYYLCPTWDTPKAEEVEAWSEGWKEAAGEAVLCEKSSSGQTSTVTEFAQRKGFKVKQVATGGWSQNAERFGIKTAAQVLSSSEQKGREEIPATSAAIEATDIAWDWMLALEMTQGKDKPAVGCYRDIMSAESEVHGFYKDDTVYMREDISDGLNKYLLKVAYEEVVHHITGATDNSRDFQNFLIDCFVELAA